MSDHLRAAEKRDDWRYRIAIICIRRSPRDEEAVIIMGVTTESA